MPSIINSDNGAVSGSAGLKFTSADDGVLEIQNNGNTAVSISSAGIATFAQPPLTAVPAFRGYLSADQSITSSVVTKVNIDTVTGDGFFDTNDWFDTTNYRYTPQIAGYYFFNGVLRLAGTSQTIQATYLFKNGSMYTTGVANRVSTSAAMYVVVSGTAYMNGTTDYMELHGFLAATSPRFDFSGTGDSCFFEGFLVRAT